MRWSGKRTVVLLFVALAVFAAVTALFIWRRVTPPLVARILPESQGIIYFNLSPLRAATHFDQKQVTHAPDYQHFIDATGINFEKNLDQAAFALDRLPTTTGPNGGLAFSEVFAGRFNPQRLTGYLESIAVSKEQYAGHTIYSVSNDGRTVRVAVIRQHGEDDLVLVSNTPTPEQMHSMLDRERTAWLPIGAAQPELLTEHYRDIPSLSLAWGVGQIGLPFGDHGEFRVMGFTLPIHLNATFVASLRWTGALRMRIEEIAPNEAAAQASAAALSNLLKIGQLAAENLPGHAMNPDMRAFVKSASVIEYNNRAVLKATLPQQLLHEIVSTPDALASGPSTSGR